jgi:hypothetical protein
MGNRERYFQLQRRSMRKVDLIKKFHFRSTKSLQELAYPQERELPVFRILCNFF